MIKDGLECDILKTEDAVTGNEFMIRRLTEEEKQIVESKYHMVYEILSEFELDEQDYFDSACDGLMMAVQRIISLRIAPHLVNGYIRTTIIAEIRNRFKELKYISKHEVISIEAIEALGGYELPEESSEPDEFEEEEEAEFYGESIDDYRSSMSSEHSANFSRDCDSNLIGMIDDISDSEVQILNVSLVGNTAVELGKNGALSKDSINAIIGSNVHNRNRVGFKLFDANEFSTVFN